MHLSGKILKDSLLKNALFQMIAQVSNLSTGFFFWIIAARSYSTSDVGIISALLSAMMLLGLISNLGFNVSMLLYLPSNHEKANNIINSCFTISSFASLIISSFFIIGIGLWAPSLEPIFGEFKNIIYFLVITCISSISVLFNTAFMAGRRSSFQLLKDFSFGLVKIFPLPMLAAFGAVGIYLSWGIGLFFSIALGYILLPGVWKNYRPGFALDPIIKKMASLSFGNYLAGIFSTLPRLALPIMIANTISTEAAGYFYIAMVAVGLLFGVSQSVSSSLMAEASASGELWINFGKSVKFSIILLVMGLMLFLFFGKSILNIFDPVYGENAYVPMILLSIASLPLCICAIFSAVRNSQKRIKSVVVINAFTVIVTLASAYPLMKMFDITGAAAAFLLGNIVSAVAVIVTIKDPKNLFNKHIFKYRN